MKTMVKNYTENVKKIEKSILKVATIYNVAIAEINELGAPIPPNYETPGGFLDDFLTEYIKQDLPGRLHAKIDTTDLNNSNLTKYICYENLKPKNYKKDIHDFCGNDKERPAMMGVFHDQGYIIATDARILIKEKTSYIESFEGKIVDKKNITIDAHFPNYNAVIPKSFAYKTKINLVNLAAILEQTVAIYKKATNDTNRRITLNLDVKITFNTENLLKAVKYLIASGITETDIKYNTKHYPAMFETENITILVMPFLNDNDVFYFEFTSEQINSIKLVSKTTKKKVTIDLETLNKSTGRNFKNTGELIKFLAS